MPITIRHLVLPAALVCLPSVAAAQQMSGPAWDFYRRQMDVRGTTADAFARRVALLDSAVRAAPSDADRGYYAFRRGREAVSMAAALMEEADRDASCEGARRAVAAWRAATPAFAGARSSSDIETVELFTQRSIPFNTQRAQALESRLCAAGAVAGDPPVTGPDARGTIRRLTDAPTRQLKPAIDHDRVAFNDQGEHVSTTRQSYDVMHLAVMDLATGEVRRLTRDSSPVRDEIALRPGAIAWVNSDPRGFRLRVLADGGRQPVTVAGTGGGQSGPSWSGAALAYVEDRRVRGSPEVRSIMLRQGAASRVISTAADGPVHPFTVTSASGGRVIWMTGAYPGPSEIRVYDIASRRGTRLPLEPARRSKAVISGDRIAWLETRGQANAVMVHDLATGVTREVSRPGAGADFLALSGDWVVWVRGPDIFRFDLASGEETLLTGNRRSTGGAEGWGARVVWWDERRGNDDIYLYDEAVEMPGALQPLATALDALDAGYADPAQAILAQAAVHLAQGSLDAATTSLKNIQRYLRELAGRGGAGAPLDAARAAASEAVRGVESR